MESVNIPSETVPQEMKPCEQILRRAKELQKAEPVVAYWCCFSAAQRALKVPNRSGEGTKWLMSLLDALEEMKALLATNEAVTNEAAGAAYVENFALKVFMSADNDDRKGISGKGIIRRFVVAGQFMEVLRCFENGMTEEMEQKLQYARWKAADGAKALREGRMPTSGPPIPEPDLDPFPSLPTDEPSVTSPKPRDGSFSSTTRPAVGVGSPQDSGNRTPTNASSPPQPRANLPPIDTTSGDLRQPHRSQSASSGAWSTVATPGLADAEGKEPRFDFDTGKSGPSTQSPDLPETPTAPGSSSPEKKNVRFMGPDGAPLSPAQTFFSTDSYDVPDAPPPTTFSPSPTKAKSSQTAGKDASGGHAGSDSSATHTGTAGTASSGRGRADSATRNPGVVPPPPPPSLAGYPSAPPNGLGLTSPPPSAPPQSVLAPAPTAAQAFAPPPIGAPITPTRKQVEQTQKHAKWAISALDFDDYETARAELRKALAILEGWEKS